MSFSVHELAFFDTVVNPGEGRKFPIGRFGEWFFDFSCCKTVYQILPNQTKRRLEVREVERIPSVSHTALRIVLCLVVFPFFLALADKVAFRCSYRLFTKMTSNPVPLVIPLATSPPKELSDQPVVVPPTSSELPAENPSQVAVSSLEVTIDDLPDAWKKDQPGLVKGASHPQDGINLEGYIFNSIGLYPHEHYDQFAQKRALHFLIFTVDSKGNMEYGSSYIWDETKQKLYSSMHLRYFNSYAEVFEHYRKENNLKLSLIEKREEVNTPPSALQNHSLYQGSFINLRNYNETRGLEVKDAVFYSQDDKKYILKCRGIAYELEYEATSDTFQTRDDSGELISDPDPQNLITKIKVNSSSLS